MRDVAISPDGNSIAFEYKGDIYTVSSKGGEAVRLTTSESYDCSPVWSPNGSKIAFSSDRNGNFDIFVMPVNGGAATRVTTNSTTEKPMAFSNNGKYIFYCAHIQDPSSSILFPSGSMREVYKVSVKGGRPEQVMATPAERINFSKSGKSFLYMDCKGGENYWRKHHTSSITRDIWIYDTKTKTSKQLINRAGEDRDPRFAPDQKTVYFLTEKYGTFNVAKFNIDNPKEIKRITKFKTHPVRFLSVSKDGKMCYTYDGKIYVQNSEKSSPKSIKVKIVRDDEPEDTRLGVYSGASEAVVSPDGKMVAFVKRGEVFVTSVDYRTTKQITDTPEAEHNLAFSPDSRSLAYGTERNGIWQICVATMERKEDIDFPHATLIKEKIILPSKKIDRDIPQYSPDGKELAFVEGRKKIMVYNFKSKKTRQITDGKLRARTDGHVDYSWSPDGKWFTLSFVGNMHDPYSDVGIVSSKGGEEIVNLTNSAYFDGSPKWVLNGNAILYSGNKYGMRNHASWGSEEDVFLIFLNKDAYDKFNLSKEDYEMLKALEREQKADKAKAEKKNKNKKESKKKSKNKPSKNLIKIDWKNITERVVRLTQHSSNLGDAIIDKNGKNLYFFTRFQGRYDLWTINLREGNTRKLKPLNSGWASLQLDKSGKNLFILGSSFRKMSMITKGIMGINFAAVMEMNTAKEREYMYNHVYQQIKKRFYNKNLHGVDWDMMIKAYRKFLPHINNNYDFAQLLSELLGELNVSHTGSGYFASKSGDSTSQLGLFFDVNSKDAGLKVTEVLEGGPFDRATSKVKSGVVLEKINGTKLQKGKDYFTLLNNIRGKRTLLGFYNPKTKTRWVEVIKPISKGYVSSLLYKRWVKREAALVDKLSNGRLGYVHIPSMNDAAFREMYSKVLGKYNKKDGIVIDTRFNGGGRLHEDVEIFFTGKKYLTQVIRGKEACTMPSRRWTKASIMLTCESNYSNAHGTPWVYQHMNIGKVVGAPVPGTMTSVNWETLQDRSLYFGIPVIGYRTEDGRYLENTQLEPDFKVLNDPNTVVKGEDKQLKVAVKQLLKQIDSAKK